MSRYDALAARYGVELEAFTGSYLDLFGSKGVKVLERFIQETFRKGFIQKGDVISTTELIGFVEREEKEQVRLI
jgi:hypothetical protein